MFPSKPIKNMGKPNQNTVIFVLFFYLHSLWRFTTIPETRFKTMVLAPMFPCTTGAGLFFLDVGKSSINHVCFQDVISEAASNPKKNGKNDSRFESLQTLRFRLNAIRSNAIVLSRRFPFHSLRSQCWPAYP